VNSVVIPINPAGGIYSNVIDLSKWISTHINVSTSKQLLQSSTMNRLHTPQFSINPSTNFVIIPWPKATVSIDYHSYTFGWHVEDYRGWRHLYHNGQINGYNAIVSFLPDMMVGVTILSNTDNIDPDLINLAYYSYDLLLTGDSWVTSSIFCSSPLKPLTRSPRIERNPIPHNRHGTNERSLKDYAGVYSHPLFGEFNVFLVNSTQSILAAEFQSVTGILVPQAEDDFFIYLGESSIYPQELAEFILEIQFQLNVDGDVDSFATALQSPQTPDVIFTNNKWVPRSVGFSPEP